jgi:alanine racemase
VGYNLTYEATKTMKIAVIPVGYYEGLDRRLSNSGSFIIKNISCPIIGRVCMNISIADISKVNNVREEDEAVIFSDKLEDKNSIQNTAKICGTNAHEILVHIPAHLRRVIVK